MNFTQMMGAMAILAGTSALAQSITLDYRYQEAHSGTKLTRSASVDVPRVQGASDARMEKTLFVIELGNSLKQSLSEYGEICKDKIIPRPIPRPFPIRPLPAPAPTGVPPIGPMPPIQPPVKPPVENDCKEKRIAAGQSLLQAIGALQEKANRNPLLADALIADTLDLGRKLAKNMKEAKPTSIHFEGAIRTFGGGGISPAMASPGMSLTAGGAQDFGFIRKTIENGGVPRAENLALEGFLSEFDLSLTGQPCQELVCVQPAVTRQGDKLFVQVGMNSNVTKETFKRKPLNLAVVLDVSGSMSATDNTEKSRLEWAKDALIRTIEELGEEDLLSIVLFDTKSEVLVEPTAVSDRETLIAKVKQLKTKGSTNLEAGLRDGYELVSENVLSLDGYENRVILISDAGLNTGTTEESSLLKLVTDFSSDGIGLTAIGLGLNFNQTFIHGITSSEGGNYMFVQSGSDMYRFFQSFDFLVTPVAYNFKVKLDLRDLNAELVKTYGVPAKEGEPVQEIINIQTLFFSEAGGAIVLEYDLN